MLSVLSGRGLCDELITRPEESYRLWRVVLITKPRERGGHSSRWAAESEIIIIIMFSAERVTKQRSHSNFLAYCPFKALRFVAISICHYEVIEFFIFFCQ
jgi:hypothetical protein